MNPLLRLAFVLHLGGAPARPPVRAAMQPRPPGHPAAEGAAAPAGRDPWLGEDKLKHFFMSMAIVNLGYGVARAAGVDHRLAVGAAAGVGAVAGLGKELYDRRTGGDASVRDLAWDALGVVAGAVLAAHSR